MLQTATSAVYSGCVPMATWGRCERPKTLKPACFLPIFRRWLWMVITPEDGIALTGIRTTECRPLFWTNDSFRVPFTERCVKWLTVVTLNAQSEVGKTVNICYIVINTITKQPSRHLKLSNSSQPFIHETPLRLERVPTSEAGKAETCGHGAARPAV